MFRGRWARLTKGFGRTIGESPKFAVTAVDPCKHVYSICTKLGVLLFVELVSELSSLPGILLVISGLQVPKVDSHVNRLWPCSRIGNMKIHLGSQGLINTYSELKKAGSLRELGRFASIRIRNATKFELILP